MMDELEKLRRDKNQSYDLKSSLNSIIKKLNQAITDLDVAILNIQKYYTVNDNGVGCSELKDTRSQLIHRRNYIQNVILPELNQSIQKMRQQIETLEFTE